MTLNPLSPTPADIWLFRQNRPTLIARDLEKFGVPKNVTYAILMARGVFKWLAVRRDLIKLKNHWRDDASRLQNDIVRAKRSGEGRKAAELKFRLAQLNECRKQVGELCHSERWRAPEFDGEACKWLWSIAPGKDVSVALRRTLRRVSKWSTMERHAE